MQNDLSSQMEDYLEAIYLLCQDDGVARVKNIAEQLDVTNASVVGALKNLKRRKLVNQEPYGYVRLTNQGHELAATIVHRHEVLTNFLENILCLDYETASHDACVIEHSVSPETVRRLRAMAEFLRTNAQVDFDWRQEFLRFYRNDRMES